jgi:hypothetical protein
MSVVSSGHFILCERALGTHWISLGGFQNRAGCDGEEKISLSQPIIYVVVISICWVELVVQLRFILRQLCYIHEFRESVGQDS